MEGRWMRKGTGREVDERERERESLLSFNKVVSKKTDVSAQPAAAISASP